MTHKPKGFTRVIGWVSVVFGLYFLAAAIFGVLYLASHGVAHKAFEYALPSALGVILFTAGYALLKGFRWSQYLYLLLFVLATLWLIKFFPIFLVLFSGVKDPAARASLLHVAAMGLSTAKWVVVSAVAAFFAFRHFRRHVNHSPTLEELTHKRRSNGV